MASISFLQNCPREQITFEMIESLLSQNILEGLTIEYKEKGSSSLIDTIAAFANTHGGLILVGVKDQIGPDRIVGVDDQEMTKISSLGSDLLDPPFVPEIIDLKFPDDHSKFVLLIRVFSETSTRPVVTRGKVLVRYPGRNDGADQSRICQLFSEVTSSTLVANSYIPTPNDTYEDPPLDVYIRTGLIFPINPSTAGRPISELSVKRLLTALNTDPINQYLQQIMLSFGLSTSMPFHKEGFNRSRSVRLAWQAIKSFEGKHVYPVECVITISSTSDSNSPPSFMSALLDIKLRKTAFYRLEHASRWTPESIANISVLELFKGIQIALKTMSKDSIRLLLSEIAGIEIFQVPVPMSMHVLMPYGVANTLIDQNLISIPDSGFSGGAFLLGDTTLDIGKNAELDQQVDQWMLQIALDAGLEGMEHLVQNLHPSN